MDGPDVIHHRASPRGMGGLRSDEFAAVLDAEIAPWAQWSNAPVIACGMVGSRQGWFEAPYAQTPAPAQTPLVRVPESNVWIAGGISQAHPADVMRGEETQIAGLIATHPAFDGVICLPGTHTKWVRIAGGEITQFQSFMTGEIFSLLSEHSVLRHTVGAQLAQAQEEAAFDAACVGTLADPASVFSNLFRLRAEALLDTPAPDRARATLSGLMIGAELAAAKSFWQGVEVALIGAPALSHLYGRALEAQGVAIRMQDASAMTLAGLYQASTRIGETR
jgi:2-dehydro-3-deoxygalactonokinase